jgi:hypothetical protein
MEWLNSQPWVRPALIVVSGVAALVKVLAPAHTIAYQIADKVLTFTAPLAAGSIGMSSSGLKPAEAKAVVMVPKAPDAK